MHLERVRPPRLPAVRAGLRRLRRAPSLPALQVQCSRGQPAIDTSLRRARTCLGSRRAQDLAEEDHLSGVGLDLDGLARAQRASQG